MKHNLLKTLLVSALALGAWGGVSADDKTIELTSTESAYVDQSNPSTVYNGSSLTELQTYYAQYRDWGASDGTIKTQAGTKIVFYKFDLSQIKSVKDNVKNVTFGFNIIGTGDGKYVNSIRTLGYNSEWSASTLCYDNMSNSAGTITGVVTATGSFQPLDTKTEFQTGTSFPYSFEANAKTYVMSAVDADKSYVTIAIIEKLGRIAKYSTSATISVTYSESSQASYTVNYKDKEGNLLKTEFLKGAVGEKPSFETDVIFNSDKTKKYIYESDDAETVGSVNEDGTTVYTLTYREAETYSYTVKSNIDGFSTTETGLEGETVKVPFPYYLLKDGTIYKTTKQSNECNQTISLTEDNMEVTLNYSATDITDVIYFSEAEDIEGLIPSQSSNANVRCSMATGAYPAADTKITNLPAGKYKLRVCVWGNSGTTFEFNAGSNSVGSFATKGYIAETSSDEFTISSYSPVYLKAGGDANKMVDYIIIQKTGDVDTETATITDAGFATYVPSNNVVVPSENVTVYTAKVADNKVVNLTAVEAGTVLEANQGYVIAGAAGDYSFTVTEDAAKTLDNDLKAAIADVTADGTQYVLAKQDTNVGFSKVEENTTIAAGKAYLVVNSADQTSAKAFLAIGGGTTGVEAIEAATADNDVYYSISGVKTTKPAKGLYIHNGKKVIVK